MVKLKDLNLELLSEKLFTAVYRSSYLQLFFRIAVLKDFVKSTRKKSQVLSCDFSEIFQDTS